MTRRRSLFLLVCIISISGFTKIMLFFWVQTVEPNKIFLPDSTSYINTARAFLETGRFAVSPDMTNVPQIVRTPGYPLFITGIFYLFGTTYIPLILSQILISLATIILVYHLAFLLWNHKHTALIAVLIITLDIPSLVSSQHVLTETLFTFILTLTIITGIQTLRKMKPLLFWTGIHGLCLACATLIRPVAYYVIFLLTIIFVILWRSRFGWSWKTVSIMVLVLTIPWITLVGGWKLRNYLVAGNAALSCVQGTHLLFYFGADIISQRDGISFNEARYQRLGYGRYAEVFPETKDWSIAQLGHYWKQEGQSLIRQYPWLFLKAYLRAILKTMLVPGEYTLLMYIGNYRENTGPIRDFLEIPIKMFAQKWLIEKFWMFGFFLAAAGYLCILYAGILFSLWQSIRSRNHLFRMHIFIWLIILYFIGLSGGSVRFRIPIMPVLAVYAAHGITYRRFSTKGDIHEKTHS